MVEKENSPVRFVFLKDSNKEHFIKNLECVQISISKMLFNKGPQNHVDKILFILQYCYYNFSIISILKTSIMNRSQKNLFANSSLNIST